VIRSSPVYEPLIPNPSWPAGFTFSPGVRIGNLIFLSGTTATDATGKLVGPGDIVAQTRQIFRKFEAVLALAGGSLLNIVETTDYVLSLDDYEKTAHVRRELFKGPPWPAATGVVVQGLVRPDALIEIKAIAVLGDPAGPPSAGGAMR
jgi:enamine deaminase RidA (YjgF/YER057c/UK114 family)